MDESEDLPRQLRFWPTANGYKEVNAATIAALLFCRATISGNHQSTTNMRKDYTSAETFSTPTMVGMPNAAIRKKRAGVNNSPPVLFKAIGIMAFGKGYLPLPENIKQREATCSTFVEI